MKAKGTFLSATIFSAQIIGSSAALNFRFRGTACQEVSAASPERPLLRIEQRLFRPANKGMAAGRTDCSWKAVARFPFASRTQAPDRCEDVVTLSHELFLERSPYAVPLDVIDRIARVPFAAHKTHAAWFPFNFCPFLLREASTTETVIIGTDRRCNGVHPRYTPSHSFARCCNAPRSQRACGDPSMRKFEPSPTLLKSLS